MASQLSIPWLGIGVTDVDESTRGCVIFGDFICARIPFEEEGSKMEGDSDTVRVEQWGDIVVGINRARGRKNAVVGAEWVWERKNVDGGIEPAR